MIAAAFLLGGAKKTELIVTNGEVSTVIIKRAMYSCSLSVLLIPNVSSL